MREIQKDGSSRGFKLTLHEKKPQRVGCNPVEAVNFGSLCHTFASTFNCIKQVALSQFITSTTQWNLRSGVLSGHVDRVTPGLGRTSEKVVDLGV